LLRPNPGVLKIYTIWRKGAKKLHDMTLGC